MGTERKHLTKSQKDQIADLVLNKKMSYQEIAKSFGVSDDSIYRAAKKLGIHDAKYGTDPAITLAEENEKKQKKKIIISKREEIRTRLMSTERYKKIKEIYDSKSVDSFIEQWVDWHVQLKDVTASEEDTIELAIMTKIRLQDNQQKYSYYTNLLNDMRHKIESLNMEIDESDDEQRILHEKIQSADLIQLELNKDIKDLLDKYGNLQKLLNVSREQREKIQKIGGDTFTSLVHAFTDKNRRKEMSDDEEYWRIATQNKILKMKKPIEFEDGTIDPIIMDGSDYLNGQNDENTVKDGDGKESKGEESD